MTESPGGHKRPFHLYSELLRHVAEWNEVVRPFADAAKVSFVETVLRVQQRKHSQNERREERVEDVRQIEIGAAEVISQVAEQLREDVRVLLVQDAVCARKHVV